jgi:hypothetical protein
VSGQQSRADDRSAWAYAVMAFLVLTLLNEGLGHYLMTRDWGAFLYVSLKFVVLPSTALCGLAARLGAPLLGRALSWLVWVGGAVGLAYLVGLYLYPVPWL